MNTFENSNGSTYFVVAGNDKRALLREVSLGRYVIARNLNWIEKCWGGGSYFSSEEFEVAVKEFLSK